MSDITRRTLLKRGALSTAAVFGLAADRRPLAAAGGPQVKFTRDLRCSSIGVDADQVVAIQLAHKHGFQSVTPEPEYLARLAEESRSQLLVEMSDKQLVWGAAGLPLEFRRDERTYTEGMQRLSQLARGMQLAGVTRVGTWLSPAHSELTYLANFRRHATRLKACAKVLADHGLRLGLEYVGPKTLWASQRYSFIHTMAETKELIADIGLGNVGFVLDSWHWYTAHETTDDLRTLENQDIVACDLNDAPADIPIDLQIDSRRELPMATGVIKLKEFLATLVEIGYDGPIRAEPFNQELNQMDDDMAVAKTSQAMRQAFALVEATS